MWQLYYWSAQAFAFLLTFVAGACLLQSLTEFLDDIPVNAVNVFWAALATAVGVYCSLVLAG